MSEADAATVKYSISVYSDDEEFADAAAHSLAIDAALKVAINRLANFNDSVNPDRAADLVILDVGRGECFADQRLFEARRMMDPSTPLLVVSADLPPDGLREVVRLHATDWLRKSVGRRELVDAVRKCLQKQDQAGRLTAIVSAVGGSGASTIALNAAFLATNPSQKRNRRQRSILFELDFSTGSSGFFLDVENDYDFEDVLENPNRIDTQFIDIIRKTHESGFSLLSIQAPALLFHPSGAEIVLRILDILTFQYDSIIIDVPYYDTRWKMSVLEAVSDVAIVTEPVIPALRQAQRLAERLKSVRSEATVAVLVNKQKRGLFSRDLSGRDISRVFGRRQVDFIPEARTQLLEAANRGMVPIAVNEKSAYSRAVNKFLERYR